MGLPSLYENILERSDLDENLRRQTRKKKYSESLNSAHRNRYKSTGPQTGLSTPTSCMNEKLQAVSDVIPLLSIIVFKGKNFIVIADSKSDTWIGVDHKGKISSLLKSMCRMITLNEKRHMGSGDQRFFELTRTNCQNGNIEISGGMIRFKSIIPFRNKRSNVLVKRKNGVVERLKP